MNNSPLFCLRRNCVFNIFAALEYDVNCTRGSVLSFRSPKCESVPDPWRTYGYDWSCSQWSAHGWDTFVRWSGGQHPFICLRGLCCQASFQQHHQRICSASSEDRAAWHKVALRRHTDQFLEWLKASLHLLKESVLSDEYIVLNTLAGSGHGNFLM